MSAEKQKRSIKINQTHSPARNPIPGMRTNLREQGERHSGSEAPKTHGQSPSRKAPVSSPGQKQHDTNLSLGFVQGRVLALEGLVKEMDGKMKDMAMEIDGKMKDMAKEMDGKMKDMKDKLQREREAGEKRDDKIQGLTAKIRKMEDETRSKDMDEVEKKKLDNGKEEERRQEKQRLDKTKEEMNEMKGEMVRMKNEGTMKELAMTERLKDMKTQGEGEIAERRRIEAEVKDELRKLKDTAVEGVSDVTVAKRVVKSSEAQWEGATEDCPEYVILTDSNGAGVTQETVRRHIPREKQQGRRIRVYTAYTLFEAFDKVRDGRIKVEGARVVIDVTTNDMRGTRGLPRITPEELVDRVGKLIATLREKGAKGVTVCEPKPMTLMDITPFSNMLYRKCREGKIGWCRTQLGVGSLKEDGFHVLPSFL
jgi:hypothetical protein